MKIIKVVLQVMVSSGSIFMFASLLGQERLFAYESKYIDDFFSIAIFSVILLLSSIRKVRANECYKTTISLCGYWFVVNSFYHFLTENEWNKNFVLISIFSIIVYGIFAFSASVNSVKIKLQGKYYLISMIALLLLSANSYFMGYINLSITAVMMTVISLSKVLENKYLHKEVISNV